MSTISSSSTGLSEAAAGRWTACENGEERLQVAPFLNEYARKFATIFFLPPIELLARKVIVCVSVCESVSTCLCVQSKTKPGVVPGDHFIGRANVMCIATRVSMQDHGHTWIMANINGIASFFDS